MSSKEKALSLNRRQHLLDGADTADLDLRGYRRFLSVVPQESMLFAGTIRENVAYGLADEVDEDTLRSALEAASAWEFVSRLPHGVDTVVGQHGARLSGGQRLGGTSRTKSGGGSPSPGR